MEVEGLKNNSNKGEHSVSEEEGTRDFVAAVKFHPVPSQGLDTETELTSSLLSVIPILLAGGVSTVRGRGRLRVAGEGQSCGKNPQGALEYVAAGGDGGIVRGGFPGGGEESRRRREGAGGGGSGQQGKGVYGGGGRRT